MADKSIVLLKNQSNLLEPGTMKIMVGAASVDIRFEEFINISNPGSPGN